MKSYANLLPQDKHFSSSVMRSHYNFVSLDNYPLKNKQYHYHHDKKPFK